MNEYEAHQERQKQYLAIEVQFGCIGTTLDNHDQALARLDEVLAEAIASDLLIVPDDCYSDGVTSAFAALAAAGEAVSAVTNPAQCVGNPWESYVRFDGALVQVDRSVPRVRITTARLAAAEALDMLRES